MVKQFKLIEPEVAADLHEKLNSLDDAYFVDRSIYNQNKGLKGEVGQYLSMGPRAMPKELRKTLEALAPKRDFPLTEVLVNKYRKGDFIPAHIDNSGNRHCLLLSLQDSEEGLSYSKGVLTNQAGWVKELPASEVHWVEPVQEPRFTVLFLYGLNF